MKKEYIVTEVSAASDGSPYVLVSMVESKDMKSQQQEQSHPSVGGVTVLGPISSSPDNLPKELQKALSGLFGGRTGSQVTVIKLDIREYEESDFKVGDKIIVEMTKTPKEGV